MRFFIMFGLRVQRFCHVRKLSCAALGLFDSRPSRREQHAHHTTLQSTSHSSSLAADFVERTLRSGPLVADFLQRIYSASLPYRIFCTVFPTAHFL